MKHAQNDMKARINHFESHTRANQKQKERFEAHQRLLDSLFFAEMRNRRDKIHDAAPGTLNWIYRTNLSKRSKGADFSRWLRKDNSVYWISGKAASGKSTLMRHIVDDTRTSDGLQEWSEGCKLCIFSFYFWRPGSELQKSCIGLLRSLLYQLLVTFPTTMNAIQQNSPASLVKEGWTEKSLMATLLSSLEALNQAKVCIFVDGLDEYEGDYDELLNLIFKLQCIDYIKCCVSSRPETNLRIRLKSCKQLRLEHHNFYDIRAFASEKFKAVELPSPRNGSTPAKERKELIYELACEARGVFLWAALVMQSLIKGVRSGDDFETLHKRLDQAPKELNDIFAQMVAEIDEVHKPSLAVYLHTLHLVRTAYYFPKISVLTAARPKNEVGSYEEFRTACKQTENQIVARSAGLLEVTWVHAMLENFRWKSSRNKFWVPALAGEYRAGRHLQRERAPDDCRFPSVLVYEARELNWVHRSACDFIFPPDGGRSPLASSYFEDESETVKHLLRGELAYLAMAPSNTFPHRKLTTTLTGHRLHNTKKLYRHLKDHTKVEPAEIVRDLSDLLHGMSYAEFPMSRLKPRFDAGGIDPGGDMALMTLWTDLSDYDRILSLVQEVTSLNPGTFTLAVYLDFIVSQHRYDTKNLTVCPPWVKSVKVLVAAIYRNLDIENQASNAKSKDDRRCFLDGLGTKGHEYHFNVWCLPLRTDLKNTDKSTEPGAHVILVHAAFLWMRTVGCWNGCRHKLWSSRDGGTILPEQREETTTEDFEEIGMKLNSMLYTIEPAIELPLTLRDRPLRRSQVRLTILASFEPWRQNAITSAMTVDTEIYLICSPRRIMQGKFYEATDAICFRLPPMTRNALMNRVRPFVQDGHEVGTLEIARTEDQLEDLEWMIIDDVWANAHGLDATEQLLVLACVQTGLWRWCTELTPDGKNRYSCPSSEDAPLATCRNEDETDKLWGMLQAQAELLLVR